MAALKTAVEKISTERTARKKRIGSGCGIVPKSPLTTPGGLHA
jgi:hypothetical protein